MFLAAGDWLTAGLTDAMGDNVGFFVAPPPQNGSLGIQALGGSSQPIAISAKTEHPDVAAAYLDWLTSQRAGEVIAQNGLNPGFKMATELPIESGTLQADVVAAVTAVTAADSIVPWPSNSTPTMFDTLSAGLQKLLAGKMTPQDFVASVQADYDAFTP